MPLPRPTSEMNMTPMIDVLLVLLVIFMAALPLTQKGIDVQLPATVNGPVPPDAAIVVEVDASLRVSINRQAVALDELENRLRSIFDERRNKTLFISAAASLRYGDVIRIIDAARGAGVSRVGIVTAGTRRGRGGVNKKAGAPEGAPA